MPIKFAPGSPLTRAVLHKAAVMAGLLPVSALSAPPSVRPGDPVYRKLPPARHTVGSPGWQDAMQALYDAQTKARTVEAPPARIVAVPPAAAKVLIEPEPETFVLNEAKVRALGLQDSFVAGISFATAKRMGLIAEATDAEG